MKNVLFTVQSGYFGNFRNVLHFLLHRVVTDLTNKRLECRMLLMFSEIFKRGDDVSELDESTGMLNNKSLMGMLSEDKFFDKVNCMYMYEI